jgi:hypothetical protein
MQESKIMCPTERSMQSVGVISLMGGLSEELHLRRCVSINSLTEAMQCVCHGPHVRANLFEALIGFS